MPYPKNPPFSTPPNPASPGRQMAAHVQKAVATAMQAKVAVPPPGGGQMAAHVQAAIAAGRGVGQAKMPGGVRDERQVATHVERAVAGAMQCKLAADSSVHADQPVPRVGSAPRSSVVLQPMKRSGSQPNLKLGEMKGEGEKCYGVAQGHYAIKEDKMPIGTDSLGSCFAVIAYKDSKVFLAHVAAGNTPASIIKAMGDLRGETVIVVRGTSTSEPTKEILKSLKGSLKFETRLSSTGAVVFDPKSKKISTPNLIAPTNENYKTKTKVGQKQGSKAPIESM